MVVLGNAMRVISFKDASNLKSNVKRSYRDKECVKLRMNYENAHSNLRSVSLYEMLTLSI
jgi:hypothetical protein